MSETDSKGKWWSKGLQFECQGSGKCCTSHGEFGFVFMTLKDRQRTAAKLNISTAEFTRKYCTKLGTAYHLNEEPGQPDCMFLEGGNRCGIYEARPIQCRTWPFWPEVMNAKAWKKEVAAFCPGVGKGKTWSAQEIEILLKEQAASEKELNGQR